MAASDSGIVPWGAGGREMAFPIIQRGHADVLPECAIEDLDASKSAQGRQRFDGLIRTGKQYFRLMQTPGKQGLMRRLFQMLAKDHVQMGFADSAGFGKFADPEIHRSEVLLKMGERGGQGGRLDRRGVPDRAQVGLPVEPGIGITGEGVTIHGSVVIRMQDFAAQFDGPLPVGNQGQPRREPGCAWVCGKKDAQAFIGI